MNMSYVHSSWRKFSLAVINDHGKMSDVIHIHTHSYVYIYLCVCVYLVICAHNKLIGNYFVEQGQDLWNRKC